MFLFQGRIFIWPRAFRWLLDSDYNSLRGVSWPGFFTMYHVFFPVITFTRLVFTMFTCILIMSILGQIKILFFFWSAIGNDPSILQGVFVANILDIELLRVGGHLMPTWSQVLGWLMSVVPLVTLVVFAIYHFWSSFTDPEYDGLTLWRVIIIDLSIESLTYYCAYYCHCLEILSKLMLACARLSVCVYMRVRASCVWGVCM